ncbi:MAG: preprotein translocase subunit SecY [Chloroflexota bacterium]|nr:preprotein translocase subunit SecY [Chloroflexota bacterium]
MLVAMRNAMRLPDLRTRILVTLGILAIYRAAAAIPLPGVNPQVLNQLFQDNALLGFLNILSGGAMRNFSIMAAGVYPYITASIIMQLLTPIIPSLEALSREGDQGRRKLDRYTIFMTIPLAALQAFGQATILQRAGALPGFGFAQDTWLTSLTIVISLVAGTFFAIWLGELITEQGIGNGLSLIIFGGIVATLPTNMIQLVQAQQWMTLLVFVLITIITVFVIVMVNEGQRRIPVQYGKRVRAMRGNRLVVQGGQSTFVPLRVNSAGMIPLIFAQSLLLFPGTIASYFAGTEGLIGSVAGTVGTIFDPANSVYWILYFLLVIAFTYFYTDVIFRQQNLAETLQRQGGFVPGIRPGKRTEEYLNGIMSRITLVGALFLGIVAIMPWIVSLFTGQNVATNTTLLISSAGLLIVVGVVLDTMKQLEAQLLMRHYEGFIR